MIRLVALTKNSFEQVQAGASYSLQDLQAACPQLFDTIIQPASELARHLDVVEMVTPQNVKEQKSIWREHAKSGDWSYIPQFVYDEGFLQEVAKTVEPLLGLTTELIYFKTRNRLEEMLVWFAEHRIDALITTARMADAILRGDDQWTAQLAHAKFGDVDPYLLPAAQLHAAALTRGEGRRFGQAALQESDAKRLDDMQFGSHAIAQQFEWALEQYGLDYEVVVSESATSIDVRDRSSSGKPVIVIPINRQVTGRKLVTLLRHEIECHACSSRNGATLLHGLGGGALRDDNDVVYEGYAMYEEALVELSLFGSCASLPLPWYTLAIDMAERGTPVAEIASKIYEQRLLAANGDEDKALNGTWTTLYRTLFRGRTQAVDNGYIFPKDKAYFEGYLLAEQLGNQRYWLSVGSLSPSEIMTLADMVKIGPEDLPYPDQNLATSLAHQLLS